MPSMHTPLHNQVIVITGATSRIGLCTARMAARQGATLVLSAGNADTLERLAGEIRQAGATVLALAVDVAAKDQVAALGNAAMQRFGRIDTWINAGMTLDERDEPRPAAVATRLFKTHYWGAVHGASVALALLRQDGGTIINLDAPACARHGVKALTDTLRADANGAGLPVCVTLVHAACAGAKDAPQLVAAAILHAARHAQRDMVVGAALPVRPRSAGFAARWRQRCTAWFMLHQAQKA